MTWLASFFRGFFVGIPFGVVFNIPKYGRTIVLVLGCILGIYIITNPTFMVGFAASISGYDGLANMIGIIAPTVQQMGGNMQELMKQLFNVFEVPNADVILQPQSPQAIAATMLQNPELAAQVQAMMAKAAAEQAASGSNKGQTPGVSPAGSPQIQGANARSDQ